MAILYKDKEVFKGQLDEHCDFSQNVIYWNKRIVVDTMYGPGIVTLLLMCTHKTLPGGEMGSKEWIMGMKVLIATFD